MRGGDSWMSDQTFTLAVLGIVILFSIGNAILLRALANRRRTRADFGDFTVVVESRGRDRTHVRIDLDRGLRFNGYEYVHEDEDGRWTAHLIMESSKSTAPPLTRPTPEWCGEEWPRV